MMRGIADTYQIEAAAEWRLIGLLMERPRHGWCAHIARLAGELRDPRLSAAVAAAQAATEGEYLRQLGPAGGVSPREVAYHSSGDPGQLLAQLAGMYDAFAFRPHTEDPIDHIAVEVSFVAFLLLKEGFAAARTDPAAAATTRAARLGFIETHLAAFAEGFAQRLPSTAPPYLLATARLLAERVPVQRRMPPPAHTSDAPNVCAACRGVPVF